MKLIPNAVLACFCFTTPIALIAKKVEVLSPPLIQPFSIDQKIACTRPMREGKLNISAEDKNEKY